MILVSLYYYTPVYYKNTKIKKTFKCEFRNVVRIYSVIVMVLMYCGFNGFGQCPEKASNVQNTIVLPLKGNEDVCKPILYHHPLEGESNDAVKIFLDWSRCILSTGKTSSLTSLLYIQLAAVD